MEKRPKGLSTSSPNFNTYLYRFVLKRLLDFLFAVLLTLVLSWLFVLITFLYLLNRYSNIFFSQPRIGLDGKIFILYKFRTLNEDHSLKLSKRTFPLGTFLRRTSLDELPQLYNILKGEMSFIGPRPLLVDYLPYFTVEQNRRHDVRPGITGLAQINGRHSITWEEKFNYDIAYVQKLSFLLDVKIALKTIILLISIRKDQSLTEKRFDGK